MTAQERIKKIVNSIDDVIEISKKNAIVDIYGQLEERIFNKGGAGGKDKNEQSIGKYSTKPLLIGAKSFMNKTRANEFFKSQEAFTDDTQGFRTLKNKKVAYLLPGGYKKFRSLNGLQNNIVDLTFSGRLLKGIAFDNESIFFRDELSKKKAEGNEKRFGKRIFAPSKSEAEIFYDELNRNLTKLWK
jgi:hypothetical protein